MRMIFLVSLHNTLQLRSGDPILEFKRGNIYRITDLKFTHINASDKPYEQNMLVTVTVTVEPWIINNITPDWGV